MNCVWKRRATSADFWSEKQNDSSQVNSLHLLVVLKLLQGENVLVKIFLKLLICIVDVELLKAVDLWGTKLGRY